MEVKIDCNVRWRVRRIECDKCNVNILVVKRVMFGKGDRSAAVVDGGVGNVGEGCEDILPEDDVLVCFGVKVDEDVFALSGC